MKKHWGVLILGVSLIVFSFSAYPALAAQQEQGMHNSAMQQKGMHNGMQPASARQGTPIYIGPAGVMQIQQKLSQEGQHNLKADGIWGLATARAVKSFQQSKNLAPTGNLNIETVQALGLSDILSGKESLQGAMETNQQSAKTQGARLYISPADLSQIQQKLAQAGQQDLKADGIWGPHTRQAIEKYQQEKGQKPTGNVDLALIEHLGMGRMIAALSSGASSQNMAMGQQEQMGQTGQAGRNEARGYYGQNRGKQPGSMGQEHAQKQPMGQGAPLYAGPETVRQIQQALAKAGHNPGQVNGQWDRSTQKALKAYQKAQNLEPTGSLTIGTAQKLMGGFNLQGMGNGASSGGGMQPSGAQQNQ